jgi:gamma-glutamylcyclotransferase
MAQSADNQTSPTSPTATPLSPADEQAFTCLYFGFASNLSPRTIQQRCPGSLYVGLGVLKGWRFLISSVGFGNIVRTSQNNAFEKEAVDVDVVYGSLSFLTAQHEVALDKSEEVGVWHEKVKVKVSMLDENGKEAREVEATTYVDVNHTTEGVISKEYLSWMRKAVADGLKIGVPRSYFDKYVMQYLPEDENVGSEDKIMMLRTVQVDKEDLKYVPGDIRKMRGTR